MGGGIKIGDPPARLAGETDSAMTQSFSAASFTRVAPGEILVSRDVARVLGTPVLGTAMALSAYDPQLRIGGLLLFMFPDSRIRKPSSGESSAGPGFFADTGVPGLITSLSEAGAPRERLELRLVGSTGVIDPEQVYNPFAANRAAVLDVLDKLNLKLTAQYTGGHERLGLRFRLRTGQVTVTLPRGQEIEVV